MVTLDDVVRAIVQGFVKSDTLFTALDVSNEVKLAMPFARHREVRDLVRASFVSDIEPASYAKSPIQVSLGDGSTVEAILYHPLADSWDLDSKYDAQKRSQSSSKPTATPSNPVVAAPVAPTPVVVPSASNPPVIQANDPARVAWQNLFNTQPSLFPRR